MQKASDKIKLNRRFYSTKTLVKAISFFVVLTIILIAATWVKLVFSPNVYIAWSSGMHFIAAASVLLIMAALVFYLLYTRRELVISGRELYAIGTVVVIGYIATLYLEFLGIFAVPTALTAFVLAPLVKKRRDAFIANLFCNFLVLSTLFIEHIYAIPGSAASDSFRPLDIIVMFNLGVAVGSTAAYVVSNKPGRVNFIIRSFIIAAAFYSAIFGYSLIHAMYRPSLVYGVGTFNREHFINALQFGIIAAFTPIVLALLLQPLLESAFNLLTNSRLTDLTDHNAPLIKRMRLETPGTFSHSQSVAAFAEMCAAAIGEDPYLARACAYYHDIGKLENPEYYKENQGEKNLHDELLPEVSADIIRQHTEDGLDLCNKHRIPIEVSHVTVQHHGNMIIPVFYEKAKSLTDSTVEPVHYSYHGVTPRSKVAAIIMLCDASEAAIRAMGKPDGEKVDALLSSLIAERIEAKQFDKCDISLKDLTTIKDTIIKAHGGLYHSRLAYPEGK